MNFPLIQTRDILALEKNDSQVIFNQLARWRQRGLIVKLKRGVYMLNGNDRKLYPEKPFVANQLYAPSYVSLEYALSFYGLIPEKAADVTSVTTKKTASFENEIGKFVYQHIRPKAFRGYKAFRDPSGGTYLLAEPEKAAVDFVYLNLRLFKPGDRDIFGQSYRFQNTGMLKLKKIKDMALLFENRKLTRVIAEFCEFVKEERGS